jgi:FKBP-type peptidyl-prolyl cis-trans isomerase SlyD
MKIENNKVVALSYELRTEGFDSELTEKTHDGDPLEFIYGMGMMIPKFEENLTGLTKGDTFKFQIKAAEAYGLSNPENIVELPNSTFEVDGKIDDKLLTVGNMIAMQDQSGRQMQGLIKELKEDSVIMDFNHPMADKDLYFKGEILEVRDASPEELDHGHVHGEGHHHH